VQSKQLSLPVQKVPLVTNSSKSIDLAVSDSSSSGSRSVFVKSKLQVTTSSMGIYALMSVATMSIQLGMDLHDRVSVVGFLVVTSVKECACQLSGGGEPVSEPEIECMALVNALTHPGGQPVPVRLAGPADGARLLRGRRQGHQPLRQLRARHVHAHHLRPLHLRR